MTEEQTGKGTWRNPYTSEDVLQLINENGDTAKDLDLSEKWFKDGIDLSKLDLSGVILKEATLIEAHLDGASLIGAHLEEASLVDTHLEGARLSNAQLERADLVLAHLEGTDLSYASLESTRLAGVRLSSETRLETAEWGNYILADETPDTFEEAENIYRRLKQWYTNAGVYDIAGEFFFRELTAQRKRIKWWPQPWHRLWSSFHSFVSGYGERPLRVVRWGALVLIGLALLYFFLRGVAPYDLSAEAFLNTLYYSAVSFTALGYGPWFDDIPVHSWVQGAGAAEAFIGVFTIALFLITFTRKMRR